MNPDEASLLQAVFHHLVLPAKLPQKYDGDNVALLQDFGKRLQEALTVFGDIGGTDIWDTLKSSLLATTSLNQGSLNRGDLVEEFESLAESDEAPWLALHVVQQNAALLVHRNSSGDGIIFEALQAAAPVSDVLAADHALSWDFPARAVVVPLCIFSDASFLENLSQFLEQSSDEAFDRFAARASKGGRAVVEIRDCPSPALVNEMLMSLLEGLGNPTNVRRINKKVRDDVVLAASELPWRRSPYWLILRITIRRLLSTFFEHSDDKIGRAYYKFIICMVLANCLEECVGKLHPEMTLALQAKLCRRLVKLESEKSASSGALYIAYDELFGVTRDFFDTIVNNSRQKIATQWDHYKKSVTRHIPVLPRRAPDSDLRLALTNSRPVLRRLLSQKLHAQNREASTGLPSLGGGKELHIDQFAVRYTSLLDYEIGVSTAASALSVSPEQKCIEMSQKVDGLLSRVGSAYQDNSILMSRYLLKIFELWVAMDKAATTACPLLKKFHPVFVPRALDVLCLMSVEEMERLRNVQQYLSTRVNSHSIECETIFSNPRRKQAFAAQFVCSTMLGTRMMNMAESIHRASEQSRVSTTAKLATLTKQYNDLTQSMESLTCTCTRLPNGQKDVSGCKRCWKKRCRKRIKIGIHEDFLPLPKTDQAKAHRAAILFELSIPSYLAAYRSTTWKLHILGSKDVLPLRGNPEVVLDQMDQIKSFWAPEALRNKSITLASRKKSFRQTHYGKMKLPKRENEVLLPFGAEFSYYDSASRLWATQLPSVPWFQHLLGSWLPNGISDPYENADTFFDGDVYHPSSYEIVASESKCPAEMSIHEFSAFQRAVSGRGRRWLVLLVELASSNINFSSDAAMSVLTRLALQAGPGILERGVMREAHIVFLDQGFCQRLLEQLDAWLSALISRWREGYCMGIIVILSLRLYHLCPQGIKSRAKELLSRIRSVTSEWIVQLRNEIRSTTDAETARKSSMSAFHAALLCRHTFAIYADDPDHGPIPSGDEARCFFRASIALQENILVNVDDLPPLWKHLLAYDISTTYLMKNLITNLVIVDPTSLEDAINETWTNAGGSSPRSYSSWKLRLQEHAYWAESKVAKTTWTAPQVVHYHLLQGHLIVDGKPLGKLPLEMREDPAIQELFGNQYLLTRPSNLLDYQLSSEIEKHQVHIGFRDGRVVIRAIFRGSLLEHIPRTVFKGPNGWDLPAGLVDGCVHWLNLHTWKLEMRRKPRIWRPKLSNWVLDIKKCRAIRNRGSRYGKQSMGACLVEPQSPVGRKILSIFAGFEDWGELTIYQPAGKGALSVEMKRLEIRFNVNDQGLLECPQLRAEVDPQQDVGALYGLSSKVILRDVSNSDRKSVLVPIGDVSWEKRGIHVAVDIANTGLYGRFTVDQLLGRLDCPPEPLLIYLKAALHALTSFPLPDSLTSRTGTEEARHCLLSARSQPWAPLQFYPLRVLSILRSLSPTREFYPPGINIYQKVQWDGGLTATIQHEDLAPLVDSILGQSQRLEAFEKTVQTGYQEASRQFTVESLRRRGLIRRQIYERTCFDSDSAMLSQASHSIPYLPSDYGHVSKESCQVYQTIHSLQKPTQVIHQLPKLAFILEDWTSISGFEDNYPSMDIKAVLDDDISQSWGRLVQACRRQGSSRTFDGHFLLALSAFSKRTDLQAIHWLVTLARHDSMRDVEPPRHPRFANFRAYERPTCDTMKALILAEQPPFNTYNANTRAYKRARASGVQYESTQMDEAIQIATLIVNIWPQLPLSFEEFESMVRDVTFRCIDLGKAWKGLKLELQRLSINLEFSEYISTIDGISAQIQEQMIIPDSEAERMSDLRPAVLTSVPTSQPEHAFRIPHLTGRLSVKPFNNTGGSIKLQLAMNRDPVRVASSDIGRNSHDSEITTPLSPEMETLSRIVGRFTASSESTRQQYGRDLEASLVALVRHRSVSEETTEMVYTDNTGQEINEHHRALLEQEESIRRALFEDEIGSSWLSASSLWPCTSPSSLLEQLRASNKSQLGPGMAEAIVQYGIIFTKVQRLLRMRDAMLCQDDRRLRENQRQEGHSNWCPLDHPEWLLLEIDNNILIRPSQIEVAKAIISPGSASNSVLQMNMGQGKTSCVMPMAVIALADKINLCRLIVPRALLLQTAQVLQSRLGGLVGRVVRHVPFARRSPTSMEDLDLFYNLHHDTLTAGGVMLCLPEHILSFKLSGQQQLVDERVKRAKRMMEIQSWLDTSCRDVLDESDFTLSTKTQLIYPSGIPTAVDGHPQRWQVIEELLLLVESHIPHLQSRFQDGIEVRRRHQGYPIIHFLRAEVEESLNALLADDICKGRLPQIQLKREADPAAQTNIGLIISGVDIPSHIWRSTAESLTDDVFGWKNLHLLRGLISNNILLLCLKKRWNVQYGLHPDRAPIAVPFEAKGVPSQTAEYGHPDTALVLTCLAFYQTGLTKSQTVQTLHHVLKSDDPAAYFERLVCTCQLPSHLQLWTLLDTEDEAQVTELWNYLRFDRNVLNHFLNNFAFPSHAKQFGVKLQASGWDIPLLTDKPSRNLTTGFSGTNDNKRILPYTIKQDDLPSLMQTNAEVLGYLLEPRSQKCYLSADRSGRHLTEIGLLELLRNQGIRILIDAGSHILEMENHDLASAWLDVSPEAQGAVYFDRSSRIMVRTRFQKAPVPLVASPFAENLNECVVYIDEAHTRGTDLKLPMYARGAVTLGLGQTKDQTVQAAMRLRQLGSTQSVAFVAPPEVYQSILRLRTDHSGPITTSPPVTSADVVHWLLEQSCKASEDMMSLHVAQGFDFCQRTNALWKHSDLNNASRRAQLLEVILQQEDQTLEQLYGPRQRAFAENPTPLSFECLQKFATSLRERELDKLSTDRSGGSSAFEEVEQEREVEFEVEQTLQKQRPTHFDALQFPGLDASIIHFVKTGELQADNHFIQAFDFVGRTSIGRRFGVKRTTSRLLVSKEFTRTIKVGGRIELNVMRPVEWVLWSKATETALVVIPEEAELLIPHLRKMDKVPVLLLTYSAPVTKSMQIFNTLTFFSVPSLDEDITLPDWVSIEVGVLAGRLYFTYSEYVPLLTWLGLNEIVESALSRQHPSLLRASSKDSASRGIFIDEPLRFLQEWLTARRQTLDIMQTPMGYVCQNRVLNGDHPFFTSLSQLQNIAEAPSATRKTGIEREGDDTSDEDSDWGEIEGGIAIPEKGPEGK